MTALCGGGTSSPKPGVANNVLFDIGLITQGLAEISPWLLPFAALINAFAYNAVSDCTTDPPPMPTFTSADALNLIGGILNPNIGVTLGKVNDALLNYAWTLLCQCDNGTPTPPPATIGPPPGIGVGGISGGTPCAQGSYEGMPPLKASGSLDSDATDITTLVLPTDGRMMTKTDSHGTYNIYGIPSTVTSYNYQSHYQAFQFCATAFDHIFALNFYNSTGTYVSSDGLWQLSNFGPDVTGNGLLSAHPGASFWRLAALNDPPIGGCGLPLAGNARVSLQVFCGTAPLPSSCCPPDSSLMTGLQQLADLVKRIAFTHGAGPTSYLDGVTHTSLSGSGSITLAGDAIGVRCTMTTFPTGTTVLPGDPPFYWDSGFITPIAAGSPLRGSRLVFTPQTIMLPLVSDQVGYTLLHGTVIDLVELLPAPAP